MGGMTAGGQFTLHRYAIPTVCNQIHYLIPVGDVHRDSGMCAVDKWKAFIAWARKKKDAHFLLMGDMWDFASTSERKIISNPDLHDGTIDTFEEIANTKMDTLVDEISFMRGRTVGALEGNHHYKFMDGTTSTQRMCRKLGCKYLGVSAFIRFSLQQSGHENSVDIWAHHGKGAARLVGGSINRVQQMAEAAQADIYLMGHDHKKGAATAAKLKLVQTANGLELQHRKQLYVRTGSFLKGYEPGRSSYIADAAMNPTDLGVVKIELTYRRAKENGVSHTHIDLHASI